MKKAIAFSLILPCFFLGAFLWASLLGFHDNILELYGFIICWIGLFGLIGIGTIYENKTIWGVINAFLLSAAVFAAAGFFGIVPYLSENDTFRTVCQYIALPLLISGGGSTTTEIIIIIKF